MLDANAVLRYVLNDNEKMALEVTEVVKKGYSIVTIEIIAELKGVYGVDKQLITDTILDFISDIQVVEKDVLKLGLETYAENNLDFVDCILYAYKSLKNYDVLTFDKKLKRLLDNV